MKKTLILILITCAIGILKAENITTSQYPDIITYNGTEYDLNSNPLEPYFDINYVTRPTASSSALWRGYVGYFEIIDNELYLTDMKIPGKTIYNNGVSEETWDSIFKIYFPKQEKVKVDWFSGILVLPHGRIVKYVHQAYLTTFSEYWLLEIENGCFNESRKYNNKEFEKFEKRQFEAFEKTEEYKKIVAEIKENNRFEKNDFIKSYISDRIFYYSTKFLIQ